MRKKLRRGIVGSYLHSDSRLGALVEVCCESLAVSRTRELRELAHDLAMHVAARNPRYFRREDVTPEALAGMIEELRRQEVLSGRAAHQTVRIVTARIEHLHAEACLLEQRFAKDSSITVAELLRDRSTALRECIEIAGFARLGTES